MKNPTLENFFNNEPRNDHHLEDWVKTENEHLPLSQQLTSIEPFASLDTNKYDVFHLMPGSMLLKQEESKKAITDLISDPHLYFLTVWVETTKGLLSMESKINEQLLKAKHLQIARIVRQSIAFSTAVDSPEGLQQRLFAITKHKYHEAIIGKLERSGFEPQYMEPEKLMHLSGYISIKNLINMDIN